MKILHLSNVIGEKNGGGVHEVVANLYKYQKSLGHEPHIWYPGSVEDSNSIRLDNNIKGLETFGNSKYGLIKSLIKPLDKSIDSFDIIHQHGVWMPMSLLSLRIKNSKNIPFIIQPHGYLEPFRLNQKRFKKKIAFSLYENRNVKSSKVILACSEDEGIKLKHMFPKNHVALVRNGISDEFLSAPNLSDNNIKKNILLYLSQIIPLKGLDRLINIIYELKDDLFANWELHIAGYNAEKYGESLKKKVNNLGLNNFIKFIGPKLGKEKLYVFDNSKAFILPTFNENFGIVVAEALSRGIPVLTTKGTPWSDLDKYECGYWVDNDNESIKQGLIKLLSSSNNQLSQMGNRGRKLITEKYLWSSSAKKTIDLYSWMIQSKNKVPKFINL